MKMLLRTCVLLMVAATFQFLAWQKKTRIVFFGDSITQAAVQPGGYITMMNDQLKAQNLSNQYELLGAGIGGNKIYDLYLRVEEDVLAKKPDVTVIWVGVNDVWHKSSFGTGTDADKFEKFYQALISKLKANNIRVVLVTPAAIGERTDFSNQQDGDLNHYANIIRRLAQQNNCGLVDLRQAFLEYNRNNNPQNMEKGVLTTDRVHLNEKGNRLVATQMMQALVQK